MNMQSKEELHVLRRNAEINSERELDLAAKELDDLIARMEASEAEVGGLVHPRLSTATDTIVSGGRDEATTARGTLRLEPPLSPRSSIGLPLKGLPCLDARDF